METCWLGGMAAAGGAGGPDCRRKVPSSSLGGVPPPCPAHRCGPCGTPAGGDRTSSQSLVVTQGGAVELLPEEARRWQNRQGALLGPSLGGLAARVCRPWRQTAQRRGRRRAGRASFRPGGLWSSHLVPSSCVRQGGAALTV